MEYWHTAYLWASIIGIAIGVHLLQLRLTRDNRAIVRFGSLMSMIEVRHQGANGAMVRDEGRSVLASALALMVILVAAAAALLFLSRRVDGETVGMGFLVLNGYSFTVLSILYQKPEPAYARVRGLPQTLGIVVGIAAACIWYIHDNWLVSNIMAILICFGVLRVLVRPIPLLHLTILCSLVVLFDVWMVWGHYLLNNGETGGSVLEGGAVAEAVITMQETRLPPLALGIPFSPFSLDSPTALILGLGDVILPAYFTLTAAVYGLHRWVLAAYAVGLIACGIISVQFEVAVPAMLPILPLLLLILYAAGKIRGVRFE